MTPARYVIPSSMATSRRVSEFPSVFGISSELWSAKVDDGEHPGTYYILYTTNYIYLRTCPYLEVILLSLQILGRTHRRPCSNKLYDRSCAVTRPPPLSSTRRSMGLSVPSGEFRCNRGLNRYIRVKRLKRPHCHLAMFQKHATGESESHSFLRFHRRNELNLALLLLRRRPASDPAQPSLRRDRLQHPRQSRIHVPRRVHQRPCRPLAGKER